MTASEQTSRGEQVAELLLRIGAVAIRLSPPFRYRSGMLSPIYTDNRLLCSYPEERRQIAMHFVEVLAEHSLQPDVLAGVSTAGIPHAAWLAEGLNLPMVYVRGEAKDHGKGKRVEGTLLPRQAAGDAPGDSATGLSPRKPNVVVVEDLVTTGGGALDAVAGVREEGGTVKVCLAICTYGFAQATEAFARANVTLLPLCSYDDLAAVALRLGHVTAADLALVLDWRSNPAGWAARHGLDAGE
ncbi:MAG: orotate phosphoribosyltransferase [Chloroflexota bacterium]